MRVLLDTQAFLWWRTDHALLSTEARQLLNSQANEIVFSVASAWELAIKAALNKLDVQDGLIENLESEIGREGFSVLTVQITHAVRAASLPVHHKDPFDRMLAAQAQAENLYIVSNDRIFDLYGVRRLW